MKHQDLKIVKAIGSKRKLTIFISFVMTLTVCFLLFGFINKTSDTESGLMSVNGREVSEDEFSMYLDFNKALVANYFKQTYDADYSTHFWSASYSDETPLEKLVDDAKAQMLRTIIELQLAQQSGVVKDTSYVSFLNEMDSENDRRSKAVASNEIVYGPTVFEVQAYYSYFMSNLKNATIEAMRKKGAITISEQELKRDYETNKNSKYARQGVTSLEWATLPYGSRTAFEDKDAAQKKMNQLQAAVAEGVAFTVAAEELGISVVDASLTNASRRAAALESPLVLQRAEQLKEGESSDIFEENGALHMIRSVSIGDTTNLSYEQVKDSIAGQMALQKFNDIVERDMKDAAIIWNKQTVTKHAKKWIDRNA